MNATAVAEHASQATTRAGAMLQVVGFRLGEEEYCIEIMKVQEIIRTGQITRLPGVPAFVRGLINLRGHVIPVVDLRCRLGLGAAETSDRSRIVVVAMAGRTVGLLVDAVNEVLRIGEAQMEPPPKTVAGIHQEYLLGLAKLEGRILILLDVAEVLDREDVQCLAAATDVEAAGVAETRA